MRLITKRSVLYTEMLHHGAVLNNPKKVLPFNQVEHPVVIQLGGCDPKQLAEAAVIAEKYGYDEINLNVGCPSPRVQEGSFGACLMKQPKLVHECMQQVSKHVKIPVTVKCRLGVDDFDSYQFVKEFVRVVSNQQKGSVKHFIIHARKALLKGLNPAQNRNIPPLQYEKVFQLIKDFPQLKFTINGGIKNLKTTKSLIDQEDLHGVMIGRTAYQNTYQLIDSDEIIFGEKTMTEHEKERKYILYRYAEYVQKLQNEEIFDQTGNKLPCPCNSVLLKPILSLYQGLRGCNKYRQRLSDHSKVKLKPLGDVIRQAADFMEEMAQQEKKIQELKRQKSQNSQNSQNSTKDNKKEDNLPNININITNVIEFQETIKNKQKVEINQEETFEQNINKKLIIENVQISN